MRRSPLVLAAIALVLGTVGTTTAQQPAPPAGGQHGGGMHHGGSMHHGGGMPTMMCPMMGGGGMSGMPMMGMMGGNPMDPKATAQMLQLRGEMMKAMGDVLIKHGKTLEGAKP